jgi:hypothetical protein
LPDIPGVSEVTQKKWLRAVMENGTETLLVVEGDGNYALLSLSIPAQQIIGKELFISQQAGSDSLLVMSRDLT